jgi:hypothetical protein
MAAVLGGHWPDRHHPGGDDVSHAKRLIQPRSPTKSSPCTTSPSTSGIIDEIYEVVFVQGSRKLAKQVLEIDMRIVDGMVNLAGFVTLITGEGLKYLENGRAQFYADRVWGRSRVWCCCRASPRSMGARNFLSRAMVRSAHRPTTFSNSPQSYKNYCDLPALKVCPLKSFIDRTASLFISTF